VSTETAALIHGGLHLGGLHGFGAAFDLFMVVQVVRQRLAELRHFPRSVCSAFVDSFFPDELLQNGFRQVRLRCMRNKG
jgi:hypothetical protein